MIYFILLKSVWHLWRKKRVCSHKYKIQFNHFFIHAIAKYTNLFADVHILFPNMPLNRLTKWVLSTLANNADCSIHHLDRPLYRSFYTGRNNHCSAFAFTSRNTIQCDFAAWVECILARGMDFIFRFELSIFSPVSKLSICVWV